MSTTETFHSEPRVDEQALTKQAEKFGSDLAKICGELTRFTVTVDPEALKTASIEFARKVAALCGSPKLLASSAECDGLADVVRERRDLADEIKDYVEPMASPLYKLHKLCTGWRSALIEPLSLANESDEKAIARFVVDDEIATKAARNEAQAAADKKYDAQVARDLKRLEKAGKTDEAERLRANADLNRPIVPTMGSIVPKGVTVKRNYRYEVVNALAVDRAFLMLDEKKIKEQVGLLGPDAADVVGGIRVVETDPDASVRR